MVWGGIGGSGDSVPPHGWAAVLGVWTSSSPFRPEGSVFASLGQIPKTNQEVSGCLDMLGPLTALTPSWRWRDGSFCVFFWHLFDHGLLQVVLQDDSSSSCLGEAYIGNRAEELLARAQLLGNRLKSPIPWDLQRSWRVSWGA